MERKQDKACLESVEDQFIFSFLSRSYSPGSRGCGAKRGRPAITNARRHAVALRRRDLPSPPSPPPLAAGHGGDAASDLTPEVTQDAKKR